jgi:hypothetical protein
VLHTDALFDFALGLLLVLAVWDDLFLALGLPPARPAIYAEIAGVLLWGYAYLLWVAPDYAGLTRRVATITGAANVAAGALLLLWVASGPGGMEVLGGVLIVAVALALLGFAYLEARIAGGHVY